MTRPLNKIQRKHVRGMMRAVGAVVRATAAGNSGREFDSCMTFFEVGVGTHFSFYFGCPLPLYGIAI